jgi:hypothetical protein
MKLTLLAIASLLVLAAGCASQAEDPGKPAQTTGTPPPSAGDLPPALPPGKTPGPGRVP